MSGGRKKHSGAASSRPQGKGAGTQERRGAGTQERKAASSPVQGQRGAETQEWKAASSPVQGQRGVETQERKAASSPVQGQRGAETQERKAPAVLFGSRAASTRKPSASVREPAENAQTAETSAEAHGDAAPPAEKPAGPPILEVEDINVYYGSIHAIKGISFEVREGEIVTLIGANGAGKSTTLNTVAGLLRSRTGSVSFLGESLAHVPCHQIVSRGLALVPEGRRIFLQMTVRENLEMGGYTRSPAGIEPDLEKVYHYFPRLQEREGQIAGTLSGGEQQMLAMGRALMSHPKLLMLDEPSMGLAPILVEQIFEIIRNLHAAGSTILLVEQNARAALSIADRGYVLETGKIVTSGRGRDLLKSPEIKKAYLGG